MHNRRASVRVLSLLFYHLMRSSLGFRCLRLSLIAGIVVRSVGAALCAADPPTTAPTYDNLVSEYMAGSWDELASDLKASYGQPNTLTAAQKTDVRYINQTLAECRPAWWKACKAGKRTQVRASIFGLPVSGLYDPEQKQGMNVRFSEHTQQVAFGWAADDMDNPAPAQHGFSKGELGAGGIWSTLGMTASYIPLPFQSLINLTEADRIKLTCKLDFRGNLAAAYYGNPRTRQWWFFLALDYYKPEYQRSPIVMSRRALAAMFVAELAAHSAQYPSIELPPGLGSDDIEQKLVAAVHDRIETHGWTLAEDKLIREATRAFALANASVMRTGGPVKLGNGLLVSLEIADDPPLQLKRDQWLEQQLAKN